MSFLQNKISYLNLYGFRTIFSALVRFLSQLPLTGFITFSTLFASKEIMMCKNCSNICTTKHQARYLNNMLSFIYKLSMDFFEYLYCWVAFWAGLKSVQHRIDFLNYLQHNLQRNISQRNQVVGFYSRIVIMWKNITKMIVLLFICSASCMH